MLLNKFWYERANFNTHFRFGQVGNRLAHAHPPPHIASIPSQHPLLHFSTPPLLCKYKLPPAQLCVHSRAYTNAAVALAPLAVLLRHA
ncbi:MAG TPA: hypothetical protein VHV10_03715, partial [Ktedonobacteraceae bacterium]|nr:hypothetical protein [Ktedonobacteraceae bacterium]